jgi:hypothetical protein
MAPSWLTVLAWLYLAICFCCAGIIAYDIIVNRRRQPMGVMNFVFPITALYFGPLAVALYWRWGRTVRAVAPAMATTAAMSMTSMTSTGDRVRDRAVWLDGGDDVRAVSRAARPHAQLSRLLAPYAGRHDHRVLHLLARQRLAG